MKPDRMLRVDRLLLTSLGELISQLHDPRIASAGLVVVNAVKTTPDLRYCKVYVSIHGDEQVQADALAALSKARRYLRVQLGKRVRLRRTPELSFVRDKAVEEAARVEEILRELAIAGAEGAMVEVSLERAAEVMAEASRLLLTTHPHPDGDAVGSLLATALALRAAGKDVVAYTSDPIPGRVAFLQGVGGVVHQLPERGFDLTVILDASDDRMFPGGLPSRDWLGPILVLDHHRTCGRVADMIYRDPEAAATGVIVFRLLQRLKIEPEPAIAEALYCALLTDTGSFRYQNTNPEAMRMAARMLERGVDPWRVASNVYERRPVGQLELLTKVLQTLKVSPDGWSAALTVSASMLQETGCVDDDVDGFVNFARGLDGVEVAILLRDYQGELRVSMRSRGTVDVSNVAVAFGGGGHQNAAGFTAQLRPAELLPKLFDRVARCCREAGCEPPTES